MGRCELGRACRGGPVRGGMGSRLMACGQVISSGSNGTGRSRWAAIGAGAGLVALCAVAVPPALAQTSQGSYPSGGLYPGTASQSPLYPQQMPFPATGSPGYAPPAVPAPTQPQSAYPQPTQAPPYQSYSGPYAAPRQPGLTGPYVGSVPDPLTPVPAAVGRPQPRVVVTPAARQGQGQGQGPALVPSDGISNPIWTRGLGLYFATWASASLPTVDNFTNEAITGALAGGTVEIDEASDGVVFAPSVAIGYSLHRLGINLPIRLEAEYTARNKFQLNPQPFVSNGGTSANVTSVIENQSVMMNLYYDFYRPGKRFQPYLGFGIGSSWNVTQSNVTTANYNEHITRTSQAVTYSLMAGFGYRFADGWMIDTRYRYVDMGEVQWGPTIGSPTFEVRAQGLSTHELGVGLRYHF